MMRRSQAITKARSNEKKVFYVEKILDRREDDDEKVLYLVKWIDYGDEANSWEPAESFLNSEVLKNYELGRQQQEQQMDRTERSARRLTPINNTLSIVGTRVSGRQRKPTYKFEKASIETINGNQLKSIGRRVSTSHRSSSEGPQIKEANKEEKEIRGNSFKMPRRKRLGRPRKNHIGRPKQSIPSSSSSQQQTSNKEDVEAEEFSFNHLPKTKDEINSLKANDKQKEELMERVINRVQPQFSQKTSKDKDKEGPRGKYSFDLHSYNGLIGEEVNYDRIDQLTKEMDEALEKIDGFTIIEEPHNYELSRLILVAKRPSGMVGYCRIEHRFQKYHQFECVPLELLIANYGDDVLEYLEDQIKWDRLREFRRQAHKRKLQRETQNGECMKADSISSQPSSSSQQSSIMSLLESQ